MKISFKFFCIAYLVVLLSAGAGGSYMIRRINDTLWETRTQRVSAAVNYGADSFAAFTDVSNDTLSPAQINDAVRQIKMVLDSSILDLEVYPCDSVDAVYAALGDDRCLETFFQKDGRLLMQSVCKQKSVSDDYCLFFYSDFTEIKDQCALFWRMYGIVVFGIAAVSGTLLLLGARRITKPLIELTKTADEIALGNYGKKADVPRADHEIAVLSQSVNAMSTAIEQKMAEIREELDKRDRFVANFSHEMKTPMTAIIGYAQILRSYELTETEKQRAADAVDQEAKRLEKLSLQLLELYVYQNEAVVMEPTDLFAIGEQLKATLRFLGEKYGVTCRVAFARTVVQANGTLLLSLLYNLADNAFKASRPNGRILLESREAPDRVWIFVIDEGKGIDARHLNRITEPFYREDKSRSRQFGGAGLGLSLCKRIAEIHGTQLMIESEKGKGTTVSFSLCKGGAAV